MIDIDFSKIETPSYVVDRRLLENNLSILDCVQQRTGAKILLALKGFAMFSLFEQIGKTLHGVTASSLFEARLGYEQVGRETHIFSPAYKDEEFDEIMQYCEHIVFNSFSQYEKFKGRIAGSGRNIECGIRINPEYSEIETAIYDPAGRYSRLGVTLSSFEPDKLEGICGLHFHSMCEQNSDTLERTLEVVEEKFGKYLYGMKWLNLGGGHHITREDYDVEKLVGLIDGIKQKYGVQVYLEPGEAVALNTGFLVSTVMDIIKNEKDIAILDTSVPTHMPDVMEMPYRPEIIGAQLPGELEHTYRLGGPSCLAGDVVGDYSFGKPLKPGDRLVFTDMAHYTMVKTNMFNGINLPAIAISDENGIEVVRRFTYEDYRDRLS